MKSSDRLSDYLTGQTFVAFDTETTGLWAPSHRIVEIGAVKFRLSDDQVETFQQLVNPGRKIPEEVIGIHGITDNMVAEAPAIDNVLEMFIRFCTADSILVAHNAPFDISFMSCELERVDMTFGENRILDTVDIYHRMHSGLESYSLLSLAKQFKITENQNHRALSDAQIVRQLLIHALTNADEINNENDLTERFSIYHMSDWQGSASTLPDRFAPLMTACEQGKAVSIIYRRPASEPTERVVRPTNFYHLKSVYYMAAFCELVQQERTFRLDRIESFEVVTDTKQA